MTKRRALFICFTPFHLFHACYYASQDCWTKEDERVLVWQNTSGSEIDLGYFAHLFSGYLEIQGFQRERGLKRQVHKLIDAGRLFRFSRLAAYTECASELIIFSFNDQEMINSRLLAYIQEKGLKARSILVEEGLGTYTCAVREYTIAARLVNKLLGVHLPQSIGNAPAIDLLLVKHPEWMPGEKLCAREVIRQDNIFANPAWFGRLETLEDKIRNTLRIKDRRRTILWLGQPNRETGVSAEDEKALLRYLCKNLGTEYRFAIKRHPREEADKYDDIAREAGAEQLESGELSWIPVEFAAHMLDVFMAITLYSSAPVNLLEIGAAEYAVYTYKLFGLTLDESLSAHIARDRRALIPCSGHELKAVVDLGRTENRGKRRKEKSYE